MNSPDLVKPKAYVEDLYRSSPRLVGSLVCPSDDQHFPVLYETKQLMELLHTRMDQPLGLFCDSSCLLRFKILASIEEPEAMNDMAVILRSWNEEFNAILKKFATVDDNDWLWELKAFTTYEFRKHFCSLMFLACNLGRFLQIRVRRDHVLDDSFPLLINASPQLFSRTLDPRFVHEEVTGPGVLREWLNGLATELFSSERSLFRTFPGDCRRYAPSPESVDGDLFRFAGMFIALVLRADIAIGIHFENLFFLQLSGARISLEDVKSSHPQMYNSCKAILEMTPSEFENLGLTFEAEVMENNGERRSYPLCDEGEKLDVTYINRERYIDLWIHFCYVSRLQNQLSSFSQGFKAVLLNGLTVSTFFSWLSLDDIDSMLGGSRDDSICVLQWRKFTQHQDFQENDPLLEWFWTAVSEMDTEERRMLITFWTAVKCLPRDGLSGLPNRFQLWKSNFTEPEQLPRSATCFYRLFLPPYRTLEETKLRLSYVSQEQICSGFGEEQH